MRTGQEAGRLLRSPRHSCRTLSRRGWSGTFRRRSCGAIRRPGGRRVGAGCASGGSFKLRSEPADTGAMSFARDSEHFSHPASPRRRRLYESALVMLVVTVETLWLAAIAVGIAWLIVR